jgi:hypothetical protein
LAEIAHILRFDLDGIVIPLARELVQNKQAVLIDVITYRLRTILMPTTIAEHAYVLLLTALCLEIDVSSISLESHMFDFYRIFPNFPPLPILISQISSAPKPFRDIIPAETGSDVTSRQPYFDVLLWLLRQDLVVQVHTRARIFARPEVKEAAWRRLWHRRRERWLANQKQDDSMASIVPTERSGPPSPSDLITPRAVLGIYPMELVTPGGGMAQWYMDYDPDLEMDSDVEEGEASDEAGEHGMVFSLEESEPAREVVPNFSGSFIFKPARAQKDEARWLRVIREGHDEVWASKFDL